MARQARYNPVARSIEHESTYNPEIRSAVHAATYDPEIRSAVHAATYDPEIRSAVHAATYDPQIRSAVHAATYDRDIRHTSYQQKKTVAQSWDDNPCSHCGCQMHLASATVAQRKKCCQDGKLVYWKYCRNPTERPNYLQPMPILIGLPRSLTELYCFSVVFGNLSYTSNAMNKSFTLARTGVDNGNKGGYDEIYGTHSLSIHGRVYTNLPSMSTRANVMSSIRSFVLDSLPDPNVRRNGTTGSVDNQDTVVLFNTLQQINPLATALR